MSKKELQVKRVLTIAVKVPITRVGLRNNCGNRDIKGEHVVSPESLLPFAFSL